MKCNAAGRDLIKKYESLRLDVYRDVVGLLTVGYGHRTDLSIGTHITEDSANKLFDSDIAKFEAAVSDMLESEITSNQFSAIVSLAYNVGAAKIAKSTLIRKLNSGDIEGAAEEFLRWDKAGSRAVAGLTRRRKAERLLFLLV
jgi:lysozyme